METTPSPFILQSGHCGDMASWTSHREGWSSRGWGGTGHSTVLTVGAGFPPDTMQTSVKFWAW